jgi:hypothetical protein
MPDPESVVALPTLEALSEYVHRTLCGHDHLDPTQTPLLRAPLRKAGRVCGLTFSVEGPRLLKSYAVWAGDEDRVLFYDCTGARFAVARLSESPDPVRAVP